MLPPACLVSMREVYVNPCLATASFSGNGVDLAQCTDLGWAETRVGTRSSSQQMLLDLCGSELNDGCSLVQMDAQTGWLARRGQSA